MTKYLVSACLLGCNCKYSGGNNYNEDVVDFLTGRNYLPICPEVDGGLPTPRVAAEIVGGTGYQVLTGAAQVKTKFGRDVSNHFIRGALQALRAAEDFGATVAILKERSPSCGVSSIYSGDFLGTIIRGCGVAAASLATAGLKLFSEHSLPSGGD